MEAKFVRVLKKEVEESIEEANKQIEYWKGKKAAYEKVLKQGGKEKNV